MPISVVCPGCLARFQVSEKYAGKEGPCPKCKKKITIPKVSDQIVVHTPTLEAGAKDSKGRSVLKPISREDVKATPLLIGGIIGGVVGTLAAAIVLRTASGPEGPAGIVVAIATLLLSGPLVFAAYSFLRDAELEPYRGQELLMRCGLCALTYAALWGAYALVPGQWKSEMWALYIAPPFVVLGALAAFAILDLEFGTAALHYAFYLLITLALALLIGVQLWTAAETLPQQPSTAPTTVSPLPP